MFRALICLWSVVSMVWAMEGQDMEITESSKRTWQDRVSAEEGCKAGSEEFKRVKLDNELNYADMHIMEVINRALEGDSAAEDYVMKRLVTTGVCPRLIFKGKLETLFNLDQLEEFSDEKILALGMYYLMRFRDKITDERWQAELKRREPTSPGIVHFLTTIKHRLGIKPTNPHWNLIVRRDKYNYFPGLEAAWSCGFINAYYYLAQLLPCRSKKKEEYSDLQNYSGPYAEDYLVPAAAKGFAPAKYRMAKIFLKSGINEEVAQKLIEEAANQGCYSAIKYLAFKTREKAWIAKLQLETPSFYLDRCNNPLKLYIGSSLKFDLMSAMYCKPVAWFLDTLITGFNYLPTDLLTSLVYSMTHQYAVKIWSHAEAALLAEEHIDTFNKIKTLFIKARQNRWFEYIVLEPWTTKRIIDSPFLKLDLEHVPVSKKFWRELCLHKVALTALRLKSSKPDNINLCDMKPLLLRPVSENLPPLRELILSSIKLSESTLALSLAEGITQTTMLDILKLEGVKFANLELARQLASALATNDSITRFKFAQIDRPEMGFLLNALKDKRNLTSFKMEGGEITLSMAATVAAFTRQSEGLAEIWLNALDLELEGYLPIVNSLANKTLQSLNFGDIVFKENSYTLPRTDSRIHDTTFILLKILAEMNSLEKLEFKHLPLDEAGTKLVIEIIANNKSLRKLALENTGAESDKNIKALLSKFAY